MTRRPPTSTRLANLVPYPTPYRSFEITGRARAADGLHEEYRDDRYVAALKLGAGRTARLFYLVRAVTPGTYTVPPPLVEDMYRPDLRGVGKAVPETIRVVQP